MESQAQRKPAYWQLIPRGEFFRAHWNEEGETVLFHSGSGDTHLLNPLGEFLFKALEDGPATSEQLAGLAAVALEVPLDAALTATVETFLAGFHKLGLLMPAEK